MPSTFIMLPALFMSEEIVIFPFLFLSAVAVIGATLYARFRKRQLEHVERLAALEKGVPLPDLSEPAYSPRVYLLRGLLWLFGGIALGAFVFAIGISTIDTPSLQDRIFRAKNLREIGATEAQVEQVMNDTRPEQGLPKGFALIGLIPMAVGAAYLIFYRVENQAGTRG